MNATKINYFFDVETFKYIKDDVIYNVPYLIGLCDELGNYQVFYNVDEFVNFFVNKYSKGDVINIWAFNASYDITSINPFITDMSILRTGQLSEKTELLSYRMRKKNGVCIDFYDLWRFDKTQSVRSWYDVLEPAGYKGSIEYEKFNLKLEGDILYFQDVNGKPQQSKLQDELDYLKRDVLILPKIYQYIQNFKMKVSEFVYNHFQLEQLPQTSGAPTISSLSKKLVSNVFVNKYGYDFDYIFRSSLLKSDFKYDDDETYFVLLNSKMGGFTSFNYDCLNFENISYSYFDINSLYPYLMTKPLPVGGLWKNKQKCLKEYYKQYSRLKNRFTPEVKKIYKIKFNSTEWLEGFKNIGKLPFKNNTPYKMLYIYEELLEEYQKILKFVDLEILEVYYVAHIPILSDVIKELYELKSNSKRETIEYNASKLILNSIYGKTNEAEHLEKYRIKNEVITYEASENIQYLSSFAGIYICSMGHMIMINLIHNARKEGLNWFYCDTDSFILPTNQNIITNIDNKELGAFKIEGIFNKGANPALSKKYILENEDEIKIASSGISTEIIKVLPKELKYKFFSKEYNLKFLNVKTCATTNYLMQKIIRSVDFESNNRLAPTHNITMEKTFINNKIVWKVGNIETNINSMGIKTHSEKI